MITTVIIKQSVPHIMRDNKTYRAYGNSSPRQGLEPLGVSASCTGNREHGALNCAAKAFAKFNDIPGYTDPVAIKPYVHLTTVSLALGIWRAELKMI